MGIAKSTWRAMQSGGEWQGDIEQQGASFILGPGKELARVCLNCVKSGIIMGILKSTGRVM